MAFLLRGKTYRDRWRKGKVRQWLSLSDGRPFKAFLNLECSPNVPFDKYTYCWCSTPKLVGLVADFYVEAMHNGEWVKLADLKDKVQHLVTLRFDSNKASQIRLTVRSAMDTDSAVVSEIRVYNWIFALNFINSVSLHILGWRKPGLFLEKAAEVILDFQMNNEEWSRLRWWIMNNYCTSAAFMLYYT